MTHSIIPFCGIRIILRQERCLLCRACELACAVAKSNSGTLHGAINETPPPSKRLRVSRDPADEVILHHRCEQCAEAACITSCKFNAITRDPITRVIQINEKMCRACMRCVKACTKQVLSIIQRNGQSPIAVKCNFCSNLPTGPQCVRACPTHALVIGLPALRSLNLAVGE